MKGIPKRGLAQKGLRNPKAPNTSLGSITEGRASIRTGQSFHHFGRQYLVASLSKVCEIRWTPKSFQAHCLVSNREGLGTCL